MHKDLLTTALLIVSLTGFSFEQPNCPSSCQCLSGRVLCSTLFLTEFPVFSDDLKATTTTLDLGANLITSIRSSDLEGFVSLINLDLSLNNISFIEDGSFSTNSQLTEIDLSHNMLREIPDNLFANTSISRLYLNNNNIGYLTVATFTGLQPGSRIRLNNNVIRTLPEAAFTAVGPLAELSLADNQIHCDCELRWLPAFINSSENLGPDLGLCTTPQHLAGVPLQNLTQELLTCDCSPSCVNGACDMSVGTCACDAGYTGQSCSTGCPAGTFGPECSNNCSCISEHESAQCDHVNGTCHCRPGYTGDFCEQECPNGLYGQDCLEVCSCVNGDCHFITGLCSCSAGYVGSACNTTCPPLRYGQNCLQVCSCVIGSCDHVTGECLCPEGHLGPNCSHNCTGAASCSSIGREQCSLQTPQHTCGPCLPGHVGVEGNTNTDCIMCGGAPNCSELFRQPCSSVTNTCGPCNLRHIATVVAESSRHSNTECFDPCVDGVMNYNETGVDCGGPLCPPCFSNQTCSDESDCGIGSVCLGYYKHPSGLSYLLDTARANTCGPETLPGMAILSRFKNAFKGRDNPLSSLDTQLFSREQLEAALVEELQAQFTVRGSLEVSVTELQQGEGDILYQVDAIFEEDVTFAIMKDNIHSGKLLGTVLFNLEARKALYNI